jgi:2-polyprenyl-6-methoxyphenol hydroxylase-like FAD-dependent oxidoreductase
MSSTELKPRYDAVVVGARCAGAATAMLMARAGARVLVVDWAEPGSDTMSTHALMRGAVMQLDRWGVLDRIVAAGTPLVQRTSFHYGAESFEVDVKPSFGVEGLYAPRRTVLDTALVDAAQAAGADVRFGHSFRDVRRDISGRVTGVVILNSAGRECEIKTGLLIGADGRRSSVARKLGARDVSVSRHATSCIYAYFSGMPDDGYRWFYDIGLSAGAIPTNDGAHCVFVAAPSDTVRQYRTGRSGLNALIDLANATNGALGEELRFSQAVSTPVIFGGANGHIRQAAGPGWALVGDAGYFKDPLTAHGITDALRDAEVLADLAMAGTDAGLRDYQLARDALAKDLFEVTDDVASFEWDLAELQIHHQRLNAVMKAEQIWMAQTFGEVPLAA